MPVAEAAGCVLAHSMLVAGRKWPKGRVLTADDVAALRAEGLATVIAARLEADDIGEDAAATRIAAAVAGPGVEASAAATGRVNLHATAAGLFRVDRDAVDRINGVTEAVTLATLPDCDPVEPGKMVATVKIIPFAVPADTVALCELVAGRAAVTVAPWRPLRAALVQTRVAGTKESMLDKTAVTTAARLAACGAALVREVRCRHDEAAVAGALREVRAAGCDLLLLIGASAITDRADVLPAAVERVGGTVEHFGMPVDPGNLLLLAQWETVPVLGLPGCARSPKLNGADWVLWRLAAGVPVGPREIMGLGVGGLVMDVPERPLPRAQAVPPPE
ncbi:molybdopterin-binding protein [Caenispirillum bisanense]|uniref:molybdopterin-binding protein n=1 Tax=Caenispirillum bisanense TaxID=414052 RepID=UPI0031CE9E1D